MSTFLKTAALLTSFAASAVPALALEGCGLAPSAYAAEVEPILIGEWTARQGMGLLMGGGQLIELEAEDAPPPRDVEIYEIGGELALELIDGQAIYFDVVENAVAGDYGIEVEEGSGVSSVIDFMWVNPVDCTYDLLPLLLLEGPVTGEDGTPMEAFGWLHFINENTISGVMQFNATVDGNDLVIRAFLTLDR